MDTLIEPNNYSLSPVHSALICSLLEDVGKRVNLMKCAAIRSGDIKVAVNFSTEVAVAGTNKEAEQEYEQKFSKEISLSEDSKSAGQHFVQNVEYILDIIEATKVALKKTNNFAIFEKRVDQLLEILNQDSKVKEDIENCQVRIENLKEEIRKTKEEMLNEQQNMVGEMNGLKDSHHLIKKEGQEMEKFAKMYFDAHITNMESEHRHQMDAEKAKVKKIEGKIERDVRCLAVMDAWTEDFCEQIELKINEWKSKLRMDEMIMEMRIEGKRRAIKAQEELIQSLNETITERLEELAPWEAEKEVERQERLAHMRRYYSCRKIQRWWRGHMVKLKLYRRRKVKPK